MKYVALMRGVAPSTPPRNNASIVPVLRALGLGEVTPVLSSGNYVFTADADEAEIEDRIEAALARELGTSVMTIVRSQARLQTIADNNPLAGTPHTRESYQLVTFFKRPTAIGFDLPYQPEGTALRLVGCVDGALITLHNPHQPDGRTPALMTWLERHYTRDLTSRTPLTLQRILNRLAALA
ncbi:MAG: DUF1697 domain-containing protein [Propionibacteriaceae bacterium]|nr:DUF1697 domain-containing protein [Propionibacteriaceae bacterium]